MPRKQDQVKNDGSYMPGPSLTFLRKSKNSFSQVFEFIDIYGESKEIIIDDSDVYKLFKIIEQKLESLYSGSF